MLGTKISASRIESFIFDELESPEKNKAEFDRLAFKSDARVLKVFSKGKAKLLAVGQKIVLCDYENQKIDYYVQYAFGKVKGIKCVTQIVLWVTDISPYVDTDGKRLTKEVFFDHIIPKAPCVAADRIQSPEGMKFWLRRISDALSKGFFVYAYMKDKDALYRIDTFKDLSDLKDELWGAEARYESRQAVISPTDIFPEAKKIRQGEC